MKKLMYTFIFLFQVLIAFGQDKRPMKERLTDFVDQTITEEELVGVSVGVLTADNNSWYYSNGFSDQKARAPYSHQTINRTASITKPITAIAIMQLVEQGKLDLDTPVGNYLPLFSTKKYSQITVRHVMQHTSGLSAYKNNREANNEKQYDSFEAAFSIIEKRELQFDPGTDFGYTSYGYGVLGMLVEKISGLSFADYLSKYIFEPAGMTQTSLETFGENLPGKAKVYHQVKPGKIKTITKHNLSDRLAGGGVQSTVEDLLKLGQAIIQYQLISKESFDAMAENHGLKKEGNGYGMGLYLYGEHPDRGNVVGHNGEQFGCSSFLFLFPEKGIATAVLSNTSGYSNYGTMAISAFYVADELKN